MFFYLNLHPELPPTRKKKKVAGDPYKEKSLPWLLQVEDKTILVYFGMLPLPVTVASEDSRGPPY